MQHGTPNDSITFVTVERTRSESMYSFAHACMPKSLLKRMHSSVSPYAQRAWGKNYDGEENRSGDFGEFTPSPQIRRSYFEVAPLCVGASLPSGWLDRLCSYSAL